MGRGRASGWPALAVKDVLDFIERCRRQDRDANGFQCSIRLNGTIVGAVGYLPVNHQDRKVELGYWVAERYQGRGIVTRAVRALTDYAFSEMNLNRVEIRAAAGNRRSRAVAERLGFELEGITQQGHRLGDRFLDYAFYGMLKRD